MNLLLYLKILKLITVLSVIIKIYTATCNSTSVGLFFFLMRFLGPHPWHIEFTSLGVFPARGLPSLWIKLELQLLAYPTATARWDPSHICHHSSRQRWILNHWARPRVLSESSWILVRFVSAEPWWELLVFIWLYVLS